MTLDGTAKRRLFIELAARPEGATAHDVHAAAHGLEDAANAGVREELQDLLLRYCVQI